MTKICEFQLFGFSCESCFSSFEEIIPELQCSYSTQALVGFTIFKPNEFQIHVACLICPAKVPHTSQNGSELCLKLSLFVALITFNFVTTSHSFKLALSVLNYHNLVASFTLLSVLRYLIDANEIEDLVSQALVSCCVRVQAITVAN